MAADTSLLRQGLETQLKQTVHNTLLKSTVKALGVIGSILVVGAVVAGVGILSYAITKVALEPEDTKGGKG